MARRYINTAINVAGYLAEDPRAAAGQSAGRAVALGCCQVEAGVASSQTSGVTPGPALGDYPRGERLQELGMLGGGGWGGVPCVLCAQFGPVRFPVHLTFLVD